MSEVSLINTLKAIEGDCESWIDNKEKDPLLQSSAYRLIVTIRDAAVAATRKAATKEKKK